MLSRLRTLSGSGEGTFSKGAALEDPSGLFNSIRAAKTAGVSRIVYTSMLNADHTTNPLAGEHQDSERALRDAGVSFTLLRNGWYTENYTDQSSAPSRPQLAKWSCSRLRTPRAPRTHRVPLGPAGSRTSSVCGADAATLATSCFRR
jgi:uncharacterized protein YbjT (DUF2867 family)